MKKYLVVDVDIENNFQYMIVNKYEDGLKVLCDYQSIKVKHFQECYDIIFKLMIENDIDELMINGMGVEMVIVEKLKQNSSFYNKTIICHDSKINNHNKILAYLNDLKSSKLALISNTYMLNDYININKVNMNIYTSSEGFLKIDKLTDCNYRKVLHLILALYGCLIK